MPWFCGSNIEPLAGGGVGAGCGRVEPKSPYGLGEDEGPGCGRVAPGDVWEPNAGSASEYGLG
ncbi:MAG TPA: hypothetical protein VHG10_08425, partial [Glycomyces sp.]|nr:hypothetical protein [Glycomyces sp.]